jgi:hypothetical protein
VTVFRLRPIGVCVCGSTLPGGHFTPALKASVDVQLTLPATAKTVTVKAQIVLARMEWYETTLALNAAAAPAPHAHDSHSHASPAAVPAASPTAKCTASALGYACSSKIADKVTLHWTLGGAALLTFVHFISLN